MQPEIMEFNNNAKRGSCLLVAGPIERSQKKSKKNTLFSLTKTTTTNNVTWKPKGIHHDDSGEHTQSRYQDRTTLYRTWQ
jgi:agmatine/peptidylarginine deiminase